MKLQIKIVYKTAIALFVVLTLWATCFFFIIVDEIYDETDDALEDYSETIITGKLAGEELPSVSDGSNNSYFIVEVTPQYAQNNVHIRYFDEMIYIRKKHETEPARTLKTIFRDAQDKYYELTVSIPTIEKEDLILTILNWMIILYAALLLTILIIISIILKKNLKPLTNILRWLDDFTLGNELKKLSNDTDVLEFKKLNEVVQSSAERSQKIYYEQRQFIGDASHEIQTPLAVCQNRLEILLHDEQLTQEQMGEIIKTRHTLDYIIKLNKTLLLLSKIENEQFQDDSEVVVNGYIKNNLFDLQDIYESKKIKVELIENEEFKLMMNETLASILLSNLVRNCFVHNKNSGIIRIVINRESIVLTNSGVDSPLDKKLIFKRFYHSGNVNSTGLGLSLVELIIRRYNLKLDYNFKNNEHYFIISK